MPRKPTQCCVDSHKKEVLPVYRSRLPPTRSNPRPKRGQLKRCTEDSWRFSRARQGDQLNLARWLVNCCGISNTARPHHDGSHFLATGAKRPQFAVLASRII